MIECSTVMECYWIKKNLLNKFFALHIFELNTNISIEYNMRIEYNIGIELNTNISIEYNMRIEYNIGIELNIL